MICHKYRILNKVLIDENCLCILEWFLKNEEI